MSQRNRGSEITAQIIIDGDLKGGSWAKVMDFQITPRQTVQETPFLGNIEDDLDFEHSGFDFDMTLQEVDQKLRDVMLDLVAGEEARAAYPAMQIVLTFRHRAGQNPTETIVLEEVKLKFDSMSWAGKKEYAQTKISGKFKRISRQ